MAPDQKPNLETGLKASVPLIIFMTSTIGGVFLIILSGIVLVRCCKKGREKEQQEHHEQWLARQNLDREEQRGQKMVFGGCFEGQEGVEGRDFAVPVELRTLQESRRES